MPGSLRPDVDRVGAPTFGKQRRRWGGNTHDAAPHSAWSGRIVIAKPSILRAVGQRGVSSRVLLSIARERRMKHWPGRRSRRRGSN